MSVWVPAFTSHAVLGMPGRPIVPTHVPTHAHRCAWPLLWTVLDRACLQGRAPRLTLGHNLPWMQGTLIWGGS